MARPNLKHQSPQLLTFRLLPVSLAKSGKRLKTNAKTIKPTLFATRCEMPNNHFGREVPATLCRPGVSAEDFREQARELLLADPFCIFDLVTLYARAHPRQVTATEQQISRLLYAMRQAIANARDQDEQRLIVENHLAPRLKVCIG
jgi:hypothetical protein